MRSNIIGMLRFVEGVLAKAKKWWQPYLRIVYMHVTNERIEPMLCNFLIFQRIVSSKYFKKNKIAKN